MKGVKESTQLSLIQLPKASIEKKVLHNKNQKCHKMSGIEVPKAISSSSTKTLRYGTDPRREEQVTNFAEGIRAL